MSDTVRGSREEEKFRARDTRNLARTRETGTRRCARVCASRFGVYRRARIRADVGQPV